MYTLDPITFARELIQCPSITPLEAGALDLLQTTLENLGFSCTRYKFAEVDNLYARLGTSAPNLCYAGHTDVVPVGNAEDWEYAPFSATISDGKLWGRGAADMKGGIAAYVAAVAQQLKSGWKPAGLS